MTDGEPDRRTASGERPQRVRVTGPPRRRLARAPVSDIDAATPLGGVYLHSLLRDQLWLAVRVIAVLALVVGSLPLLFHFSPTLGDIRVVGIPLAWLLLAVAVYPVLWLLGWYYVRRAERNELAFADLVGDATGDGVPPPGGDDR